MKKLLSNILIKPILRLPYWFYLFCRRYIPGYKRLPHILQEIIAFILVIQTILFGTGLIYLFGPWTEKNTVEAAWFNDNWQYRKPLTFTHNATVSAATKVKFDIDTSGAPDLIQSDCGDLRFTSPNGDILPYYLDSAGGACDTISTDFYVLIPSIINGSNYIYMYYGNPTAVDGTRASQLSESTTTPSGGTPSQGSEEKASGPVAYWRLDDGQGQAAQDSTSSNYDGTLGSTSGSDATDPSWRAEDRCVSGKCLEFDGSDDFVDAGTNTTLNATTNFSVSLWMKLTSYAGTQVMISKGTQAVRTNWHILYISGGATNQKVYFGFFNGITTYFNFEPVIGRWYHLTATVTQSGGNSTVNTYLNGQLKDTQTGTSLSSVSGKNLYLGQYSDPGAQNLPFNGFLDEVKYYNYPLSAAQVLANYNSVANPDGNATVLGASTQNLKNSLSEGLVGYWKMDEPSANSCSGGANDNCDSSGLGLDGAWNGDTSSTRAKYSYGVAYDGTGDYTSVSSNSALNLSTYTVDFWMNSTNAISSLTFSHPFYKATNGATNASNYAFSWDHTTASFQQACTHSVGGSFTGAAKLTTSLTNNTWYHITCSYDGTDLKAYLNGKLEATTAMGSPDTGNQGFYVGTGYSNGVSGNYNGKIDEVRVYNRPLSDFEVSQLNNWAPGPVGYWKLDEGSGTSAVDSSGNANNGSITAGTGGYANAKYAKGYNFDNANTLINAGSGSTLDNLSNNGMTVEAWIYPRSMGEGGGGFIVAKNTGPTQNAGWLFLNCTTACGGGKTNMLQFVVDGSTDLVLDSSNNTLTLGRWHHVAVSWDGVFTTATSAHIYINGVETTYQTRTNGNSKVSEDTSTNLWIGNSSTQVNTYDGLLDEVKIYNYQRTQAQVIEDMNAGHPAPGSPVGTPIGHWRFDEGADNMCSGGTNDVCNNGSTGNTYDGTSTATRTNAGKFNRALDFDGSTHVATISNNTAIDMDGNLANFTFSGWVSPDSDGENDTGQIFNKGANTYLRVDSESGGRVDVECNLDQATTDTNVNVSSAIATGAWSYLACSWDGTTLSVYVNGLLRGSSSSGSGAISSDTNNLLIGGGTSNNFDGKIDEFKVYAQSLTAEQIKLDMNRGSSEVLGALSSTSSSQPNSASNEYCPPDSSTSVCTGPVGEWKLDEGSGTVANDTTGNGNTGTITAGTGGYRNGKVSKAYSFDGADTLINAGSGSTLDNLPAAGMTIEFWMYPRNNSEVSGFLISKMTGNSQVTGQGWFIGIDEANRQLALLVDGSTDMQRYTAINAISFNTWQHVVLAWDGNITTASSARFYINGIETSYGTTTNGASRVNDGSSNFNIGNASTSDRTFNGMLDNIKVFNYVRSASQIVWDYNKGGPLAWYKMDECQGTSIKDGSGNGYSGTLTIGGTGGNTTPGTCTTSGAWFDGVSGKRNYSIDFDGTDDNIQVPANSVFDFGSGDFSIGMWVKFNAVSTNILIEKFTESSGPGWSWYVFGNGSLDFFGCNNNTCTSKAYTFSTGQWYFLTLTKSGSTYTTYVNGISLGTSTNANAITSSTNPLTIGERDPADPGQTFRFNGQIDDVRIYKYPLTATQVKTLYNDGEVRFGPNTGAP